MAVELRDCLPEVLRFTLESYINDNLEFNVGLSKEFCSNLLKTNLHHPNSLSLGVISSDSSVADSLGVPLCPLYKHLASALYQCITSGAICGAYNKTMPFNEDNDLKQKEEWKELVVDKGSELANILKTINFEVHVQEPYFTQLKDGLKTIEGRCAVGDHNRIGPGALILFNKCLVLEVQDVHRYASFYEMLEAESLAKVLPGVKTIEEGVQVYRNFYTEEKERSSGVLAIRVAAKPAAQPYIILASVLSGLNYGGIQSLLELTHTHTAGTLPEALPPS